MKFNFVTIHGIGFNFDEPNTFGPSVTKILKNYGDVYNCHFPLGDEITYKNWSAVLDKCKQKSLLNKNTIIVCHSLGTLFSTKYLFENKLSVFGIAYIAGGYTKDINDFPIYKDFYFSPEAFEYISKHSTKRCFLYSDNDRFFPPETQKNFIEFSKSKPIYIENMGHFSRTEKITDIPNFKSIIEDMIK